MITIQTIKRELENIRYYYARKDMFEKAFDSVGKNYKHLSIQIFQFYIF